MNLSESLAQEATHTARQMTYWPEGLLSRSRQVAGPMCRSAASATIVRMDRDAAGATTAFALVGTAGAVATLTAIVRRRTLARAAVGARVEDDAPGGAPCPSVS